VTTTPLDAQVTGSNAGTSPVTSGSFSTGSANEIIIVIATNNSGLATYTGQAGYTFVGQYGLGYGGAQHLITTAKQYTVTSDLTWSGGSPTFNSIAVATFIGTTQPAGNPGSLALLGCGQ
jgi:hypothetical protein